MLAVQVERIAEWVGMIAEAGRPAGQVGKTVEEHS